jgi:hypothetical protein
MPSRGGIKKHRIMSVHRHGGCFHLYWLISGYGTSVSLEINRKTSNNTTRKNNFKTLIFKCCLYPWSCYHLKPSLVYKKSSFTDWLFWYYSNGIYWKTAPGLDKASFIINSDFVWVILCTSMWIFISISGNRTFITYSKYWKIERVKHKR